MKTRSIIAVLFLLLAITYCSKAATVIVKISQFPNTTSPANSDLFLLASGATNKNITWNQLKDAIGTNAATVTIVNNLYASNTYVTNSYAWTNYGNTIISTNLYTTQIATNYYLFSTNLYITNLVNDYYVSNYFQTNVFADTYISNFFTTNQYHYLTNIYNFSTNLTVTNFYAGDTYVSNFFNTNIFVNDTYVSNFFATNLYNTINISSNYTYYVNDGLWVSNAGTIHPSAPSDLKLYTMIDSTVLGFGANSRASENVVVGDFAMGNTTGGGQNVAIGSHAAENNSGWSQVAIGQRALQKATNSSIDVAIGNRSMMNYTTGGKNVNVGANSMDIDWKYTNVVAVGYGAADYVNGEGTVSIGSQTFTGGNNPGYGNVALGFQSGMSADGLDRTILIGPDTGFNLQNISNSVVLGASATATANNQMVFGSGISNYVFRGLSTIWPSAQGSGYLLNDGSGNLSWGSGTNYFSGPTNTVDMRYPDQYYSTVVPCSITGLINKSTTTPQSLILTITNASTTNITLYLAGGIVIPERTLSVTISNASQGMLSLRYSVLAGTNGVYRQF